MNDVTIGIITWNALDILKLTYSYHVMFTPQNTKFIILDNNSKPEVVKWLKSISADGQFDIQLVLEDKNIGFGRGCNVIFDKAETEYLIITGPDVLPASNWIYTLQKAFKSHKNENIGILGCKLIMENSVLYHEGIGYRKKPNQDIYEPVNLSAIIWPNAEHDYEAIAVTFAIVMLHRDVYKNIKMDPNYGLGGFEDVDYCKQAREHGFRVLYTPSIHLAHIIHSSWKEKGMNEFKDIIDKNLIYFNKKWKGKIEDTQEWLQDKL